VKPHSPYNKIWLVWLSPVATNDNSITQQWISLYNILHSSSSLNYFIKFFKINNVKHAMLYVRLFFPWTVSLTKTWLWILLYPTNYILQLTNRNFFIARIYRLSVWTTGHLLYNDALISGENSRQLQPSIYIQMKSVKYYIKKFTVVL
jgi:hypothetical protein